MRITVSMLEETKACQDQIALFKNLLSGRSFCLLTAKNLALAQKAGLDVSWFIKTFGNSKRLSGFRKLFLGSPQWAYYYARFVDCGSHDDTRTAACGSPYWAYRYALYVDRRPKDDTRTATCGRAHEARLYARYVDKSPRDDTRRAACGSPTEAYHYARYIDQCPRDDTRLAADGDPCWAGHYAQFVNTGESPS